MTQQTHDGPTHNGVRIPVFTLADRLRKARELTGLEQGPFADEIGVSRGTVSNYEKGHVAPREIVLRAWALRTGVPVEWIRTGRVDDNGPRPGSDQDEGRGSVRHQGLEPRTRWLMPDAWSEGHDEAQVLPFRQPGAEWEVAA